MILSNSAFKSNVFSAPNPKSSFVNIFNSSSLKSFKAPPEPLSRTDCSAIAFSTIFLANRPFPESFFPGICFLVNSSIKSSFKSSSIVNPSLSTIFSEIMKSSSDV